MSTDDLARAIAIARHEERPLTMEQRLEGMKRVFHLEQRFGPLYGMRERLAYGEDVASALEQLQEIVVDLDRIYRVLIGEQNKES